MKKGTFYITTPIYYPSDKLHIGHTYCTVATDVIARYKRMCGYDVMFLTGTDEHGQKIEEKAKAAGVSPQQFVDNIVLGSDGVLELWKLMNISNDRFIRTTDDYHKLAIQRIFKKLYDNGDIYKSVYRGKYCTPCESFWTESQLVDGNCPDCGRPCVEAEEEAYFFRLSKYQDRLIELYRDNPEFLEPESRRNEMLQNFLLPGLDDLCVSRTSFSWGIPVDFDPGHVVYVWVDALSNYITALGYLNDEHDDYGKYWPCDVHMVGKEIVRFHAIIWPAMLMSMDEPLPKKVFGHGWLLFGGGKMSKSKGNVVDPKILAERYGVDALRYFLMREFPLGSDGNFSNELLITRINSDLANDLGNLVSRTTAMALKYFGGTLPKGREVEPVDDELISMASDLRGVYEKHMNALAPQSALTEVFRLISRANKYIDETAPWLLGKDESKSARLASVLYNLFECIRISVSLLRPFIPESAEKALAQIGAGADITGWESLDKWGLLPANVTVTKGEALFPRIDAQKELAELERHIGADADEAGAEPETAATDNSSGDKPAAEDEDEHRAGLVGIGDFQKLELRVALIEECEPVKKSDKLYRLVLDVGGEKRQVVSGIREYYEPSQLLGRKLILIANLQPAKLRGVESQGMILAADDANGGARVIFVDNDVPTGAKIR